MTLQLQAVSLQDFSDLCDAALPALIRLIAANRLVTILALIESRSDDIQQEILGVR